MIDVDNASPVHLRIAEYASERDQLMRVLGERVVEDPRIAAAWVYGSLGRGDEDELSDIDVRLVVHAKDFPTVLDERYAFVSTVGDVIMLQEAPQNRPPGGAYNMAWYAGAHGPHAIDWTWSSSDVTQIPTGVLLLHNRAELAESGKEMEFAYQPVPDRDPYVAVREGLHGFWSMLLVVAKNAARSPFAERMSLLQWTIPQLRDAQRFAGEEPGPEFEEIESHADPAKKMSVMRSLAAEASALTGALAVRGVVAPVQMEPHAQRYLDLVETVMNSSLHV